MKSLILLPILLVSSLTLSAQESHQKILMEQAFQMIREVARNTEGIVGVAMKDLSTGESLFINENLIFPQASAIKIPILIEMMYQSAEKEVDLSSRIRIKKTETVGGSGVLQYFGDESSEISVYDLAVLMIAFSDNTATNHIIDLLGFDAINARMRELGFRNMRLGRRMMDAAASERGEENLATPAEALALMELLYRGEKIPPEIRDGVLDILRVPKDSEFRKGIPSSVPLANKPGSLTGVVTEWAIVELGERPFILIFMSNYGDDAVLRKAAAEISTVAYGYFSRIGQSSPHGVGRGW